MADRLKKRQRDKPFTDIDNRVFKDTRISLKARGLLCTALSLPDNWEFSLRGLRAICKENLTAIQSALDELEQYGYLTRERQQQRGENGHFAGMDYIFTDAPDDHDACTQNVDRTCTQNADRTCTQNADRTCTQNADRTCTQNVDRTCTQNPYTENPHTENVSQEINKQEINKQDIPPVSPQIACTAAAAPYPADAGRDPRVEYPKGTTPVPPVSPLPASGGERSEGKKKGRQDKPAFPRDHEAYRCAAYLDGEIRKRLPKKQPAGEDTLQSWAGDFDKCHRIDGYDWRTVMETLIFSQADAFWQANILSGRKFRQKLLQLMAKMQRESSGGSGGGRSASPGGYIPEAKTGW